MGIKSEEQFSLFLGKQARVKMKLVVAIFLLFNQGLALNIVNEQRGGFSLFCLISSSCSECMCDDVQRE